MKLIDIYEEHLEEADFLWCQRADALADDDYDLADLAALEERLLAHVDGLVVGGDDAWEVARPCLGSEEAGEAFAAGAVALAGSREYRQELLDVFAGATGETLRGLQGAFLLADLDPELVRVLRDLVATAEAPAAAAVVDVLSFGRHELAADELTAILASGDDLVQEAGLRATGRLGCLDLAPAVAKFLKHDSPVLRATAAETAFLLGDTTVLEHSRAWLAAGESPGPRAQIWLGLAGDPSDRELLQAGMEKPELADGAAEALAWLDRGRDRADLLEILRTGGLASRHGAAALLARLAPGAQLTETSDLARRQYATMPAG